MSAFEEIKAPAVFAPPAKIEEWYASAGGGAFSSINAPTAGARFEQDLPRGSAPFQLYSLATPNGQKVGIILEELGIDYDAHGQSVCVYLSAVSLLEVILYIDYI